MNLVSVFSRARLGALAGLLLAAASITVAPSAAEAGVSAMTVSGLSLPTDRAYGIGFDAVPTNGGAGPGGYEAYYERTPGGVSTDPRNPQLPSAVGFSPGFGMSELRIEIYDFKYPDTPNYSAARGDGGVVVRVPAQSSGHNVGAVTLPRTGAADAVTLSGQVRSRTPITPGRLKVHIFQVTGYRQSSTGYRLDAFSDFANNGSSYTSGPLWTGQYLAFVWDQSNGNQAFGFINVSGNTTFDIDFDTPCFGIDDCAFTGSVQPGPGGFHPVGPNRILDTRKNIGIAGAVQPGDGRNGDPNPDKRLASRLNHEFPAAGVGGVPASGVGAVLLNVTATGAAAGGIAKFFGKPAGTDPFYDQSSFQSVPGSVLVWGAGEDTANLMIVPVGVGGKIRIDSYAGSSVHLIADVVGWFDQGQPGQDGSRLTAVTPARFLDTRGGIGGPASPFGDATSRDLTVAGVGAIPADATAVVGTVTGVGPAAQTFLTVWPKGTARQETSVVNVAAGEVRPNLVTVGTGSGGSWSIFNERGPHHVLFDAVGYYRSGTGGMVTPLTDLPKVLDTQAGVGGPRRAFGGSDARTVAVAGVGGIPNDARAVFVNLTANFTTAASYLTVWNGGTRPETSNLNWGPNSARTNLALVPLAADGTIQVFNSSGSAHVVAQVVAYVR